MDDFTFNNYFEFDPLAFNDLDAYNPFEGLPLLDNAQFSSTSPLLIQDPSFLNDIDSSPKLIQEHELRPYLEGLDVLWSPFTSPSSSQSTLASSPLLSDPSPTFSFSLPFSSSNHPPLPPQSVEFPAYSQKSTLFSPETVTSTFDYGSPSSSSSGAVAGSLRSNKRARTLSVKEESEAEEFSKRARTSSPDGPVHVVFLTAPQPASSSSVASTSRLPIATPTQARCRCVFKRGNQKPARHWRTACPYNPDRHRPETKFRCEVEGCTMDFSRRDNRDRHMRKFH